MLTPSAGKPHFFSIDAHLLVQPNGKPTVAAPIVLSTHFKDKIVIVGGAFPDVDRHQIPMISWRGEEDEVAGMLIHAQVAAQLLDGRNIEHLDRNVLIGLFAILSLLGFWFGLRHGLVAVSLYATTASILVVGADILVFHFMDLIIPFGACLAALVLGVIGGVVMRLTPLTTSRAA